MPETRKWTLGAKLAVVAAPFLLLALVSIAVTLWISWQLEGGAAAVNEAGRMRMQAYRMSLSASVAERGRLDAQSKEFEQSLRLLKNGDAERPLFVPWDDTVRARFALVQEDWTRFRGRSANSGSTAPEALSTDTAAFAGHIDALVQGIEGHMSRWTAVLHLSQMAMMAFAVLGAAVLVYTGYRFVLEPVDFLNQAIRRMQEGDFSARVAHVTTDEFGTLAQGFNGMAAHVQSMYRHLEARVTEKTAELERKRERLEALYAITALAANALNLRDLTDGFVRHVRPVAKADGVALRWSDENNQRYLMLASEGLPDRMVEAEQCVRAGDCHCGSPRLPPGLRVIPIVSTQPARTLHCEQAGFATVVSIPIRLHDRLMGEVDLFFHAQCEISGAERSHLEALTAHLAAAMENLRLGALEKEAAVSEERGYIARELHDSIAQSLAFLKLQIRFMRDALNRQDREPARLVLEEIDAGVRESIADVRELLVHFRTRTNAEDIEPALRTTLRKFEHQSGLPAKLEIEGNAMPLAPDLQLQVLHVVQEALSNVRKHAGATHVWLDVQQQPQWRFEVRDDGVGFFNGPHAHDETHVGLRIMQERAQRIGASLEVLSTLARGTSIVLTLPSASGAANAAPARAVPAVYQTGSRRTSHGPGG